MIISSAHTTNIEFEKLLSESKKKLILNSVNNPTYFDSCTASLFEKEVCNAMELSAIGTNFHNTIHLVSGLKFPDIVAADFFGVEVKTTQKDSWKTIGNSVLEATRIESVEKIYIMFGKLINPFEVKYRIYEECLYDISVTHSPRYQIDMELHNDETIFNKMGTSYDYIRSLDRPIQPFTDYYRSITPTGEEPWWLETTIDECEIYSSPTIQFWSDLPVEKKNRIRCECLARFPHILGSGNKKYRKPASWLVRSHGIIVPSFRDMFTAGGTRDLSVNGHSYFKIPRVFLHLLENFQEIIDNVKRLPPALTTYYWNTNNEEAKTLINSWIDFVIFYSVQTLNDENKSFIINLLLENLPEYAYTDSLIKSIDKY